MSRKPEIHFTIRKYRPQDRERVRWICCETGFLGMPQEAVFEGREIFADLWSAYWTDYEPEHAFVAEVEGQVEGYLLGCLDTRRQERIRNRKIIPWAAARMASPSWWRSPKNRVYLVRMLRSRLRGEFKIPLEDIVRRYPAHLHMNIAKPELRGAGIGSALMNAYLEHLARHRIKGVHLGTTSHNREAVPFYEKFGFQVIIKKRITCYDHAIPDPPLYLLYMARSL